MRPLRGHDARLVDNLTHSLFGAVLARSGLAQRHGRGTTSLLVVASNVPDVDAILMLTHGESAAWLRRTHTHCIVGAPLLGLLLAVAWWLATRKRLSLATCCGLALLGAFGHVALDLLNSYGVVALWPLSTARLELAWVYIIDLAMTGLLAAPLLLGRFARGRFTLARLNQAALAIFLAYVGTCAVARTIALRTVERRLASEGARPDDTYAFPEALGPHRWRVVAREGRRWRMWLVHVRDRRMDLVRDVTTEEGSPDVERARATPRGRAIDSFFRAPVWTADEASGEVRCFDLRFVSAVFDRDSPFTYVFPPEETP